MLAESGYDRLTMDAVATEAKASKATLYRRWSSKSRAGGRRRLLAQGAPAAPPTPAPCAATCLAAHCGMGGLGDPRATAPSWPAVVTAMARDAEFAAAYRREFIGPKVAAARVIFERAVARGEIRDDVDLDLLAPALPGIVLHRVFLLGDEATPELVARVIDQIILPAVSRP